MRERLTRWEGRDADGPRAVLVKREGPFAPILQEALRKLARFEDAEEELEYCIERFCITIPDTEEERRSDQGIAPYEEAEERG